MTQISKPVRDVLVYLVLDWVPLHQVVGAFHFHSPTGDASAIRRMSLDGISFMLLSGFVRVGDLGPDGKRFEAWPGSHDEIVAKVTKPWPDSGSEPDIEVAFSVWLDATPAGTARGNSLVEEFNQDFRADE